MTTQNIIEKLRDACLSIRSKPWPIANVVPLMQEAADALGSSEDTAAQLVYLVAGAEGKLAFHRVVDRVAGIHRTHPITEDGGHTGMVADLIPYARLVSALIAARINQQDFPGVFEYEVTEPLGGWLADNWDGMTDTLFASELTRRADEFFNR